MLYKREQYLEKIRPFYHDCDLIKIVTGIRRCGKSCLLQTIAQELKDQGIPESDIIYLNLDQYGLQNIATPQELDALVQQRMGASPSSSRAATPICCPGSWPPN